MVGWVGGIKSNSSSSKPIISPNLSQPTTLRASTTSIGATLISPIPVPCRLCSFFFPVSGPPSFFPGFRPRSFSPVSGLPSPIVFPGLRASRGHIIPALSGQAPWRVQHSSECCPSPVSGRSSPTPVVFKNFFRASGRIMI